jgi:hypothetical protein
MKIIRYSQSSKKSVKFSDISYAHTDDFTEFVPTKYNDGVTFYEQVFEKFMFKIFKRTPYDVLIETSEFKHYKHEIELRIIRLINNFYDMLEKHQRGVTYIKRYNPDGTSYNYRKKVGVPILSYGGGKNYYIDITYKVWIKYLFNFVKNK